tara:strand:+ start:424 stop:1635 length:1212 start_codon:yes stop_codon:yes gene_type:complete
MSMENLTQAEVVAKGLEALKNLDLENAEKYFNYGLQQNEYSSEVHLGFAKLYLLQQKLDAALFWAKKARDLAEDKGDAYALIATCHLMANQVGQAVNLLQKALKDSPENPQVLSGLGKALIRAGKHAEAKPHLLKALETTDAPELVNYDLALAFADGPEDVSDFEKAVDYLTASIEANPGFAPPYFLLSHISVKLEMVDQAIEILTDGLAYNPNMLPMWEELHGLYMTANKPEKAMVQAMELVSRRGDPTDYIRVGNTALFSKDHKGALLAYKQAHELNPKDPTPLLNMAHVHRVQQNKKQAIKYYRQTAQIAPQWHRPFLGMGLIALQIDKNHDEARDHLLAALKIAPEDHEVCFYLALCAQEQNNDTECQKYAKMALATARSPREAAQAQNLLTPEVQTPE